MVTVGAKQILSLANSVFILVVSAAAAGVTQDFS